MKRLYHSKWIKLLAVVFALAMLALPTVPAFAATTADVTVTATPQYLAITSSPGSYDFGAVAASSNTTTANTTQISLFNTSSVTTNMTISVTGATWTGGNAWTHSDTGTPGAMTVGLYSNPGGTWGTGDVLVKNAAPVKIKTNQAANTNFGYGLDLLAPTSYTDGVQKTNTVRITVSVP